MSRSITAQFQTAVEAFVSGPIWLIEIGLVATVRYTTAESAITYNGNSYTPQDFQVSPSFDNTGAAGGTVAFQGVDETFTALFRQGNAEGSTIKVWITSKQASYSAAGDAAQLFESTIDQVSLTSSSISLNCVRQPIIAPNKRVDAANGFNFVTRPGVVQFPAGAQVLV